MKNASKRKQFLELPSVSSNSYPSMMILIEILYEIQQKKEATSKVNLIYKLTQGKITENESRKKCMQILIKPLFQFKCTWYSVDGAEKNAFVETSGYANICAGTWIPGICPDLANVVLGT